MENYPRRQFSKNIYVTDDARGVDDNYYFYLDAMCYFISEITNSSFSFIIYGDIYQSPFMITRDHLRRHTPQHPVLFT